MKKTIFLLLFFFSSAFSSTQTVGRFDHWTVFKTQQGKKTSCYALIRPNKTSENSKKRKKKPYFMVSILNNKPFIMLYAGNSFKDFSTIKVCPGEQCYTLHTKKDRAWAADEGTEKKIIDAMKNHQFLKVQLPENAGHDHYVLKGFSKAYDKLLKCCKP